MFLLITKISSFRRFKKYTSLSGCFTNFLALCDGDPIIDNVTHTVTLSFSDSEHLNACSFSLSVYNVVHRVAIL